jgi:hypothetical protein
LRLPRHGTPLLRRVRHLSWQLSPAWLAETFMNLFK